MLKYITKGNQDPQGLPKVYFCSHPQDQRPYLEPVSKQILSKLSCAIFYCEDPTAERSQDSWEDMSQFQLLVIPVTTAFLSGPHPGIEEFRFAVEHHIPILPLMQEQGLETLFNKICGDIQFLDPTNTDPTAISFDEKLEKFLRTILVGDETATRIRKAFRGSLFLSYRKKDRRHAQRLMRLIHKQPCYRDMAIWYDEFLTPGENFNENIRLALEKSHLFVLAVTPNLVCETNYIMTTEYPMAIAAGKPILPFELVATDPDLLQQHYPGLSAPTDADDEHAVTVSLADAVEKLQIPDIAPSVERDYLMGLAYLSGVDVEVDHSRAVEMITACAESDYAEAMEKLVAMYQNGIGVTRNYETAIFWQQRLSDHYRAKYEASREKADGFLYLSALLNLGDAFYDIRKLAQADQVYNEAVEFSFSFEEAFGPIFRTLRCRCLALNALGMIQAQNGQPALALRFHRMAMKYAVSLADTANTLAARRDVIIGHFRIGDLLLADAKLSEALTHYTTALDLSAQLAAENKGLQPRQDLLVGRLKTGDIRMQLGQHEDALANYRTSLELAVQLAEEEFSELARLHLGVCHEKLGNVFNALREHQRALQHYRESLTIRWKLAEETDTIVANHSVMISHLKLGIFLENTGEANKALVHYQHALAFAEQLTRNTQTLDNLRHLSVCHGQLGSALKELGKPADARVHFEAALELNLRLHEETGTIQSRQDLGIAYQHLGDVCLQTGKLSEALQHLNAALEVRQALANETATMDSKRDLSITCSSLAKVYLRAGKGDWAHRFFRTELGILEELLSERETPKLLQDLFLCQCNLGSLFRGAKQSQRALEFYLAAISTGQKLSALDPAESIRRGLNIACIHAGDLYASMQQYDQAVKHYTAALEICRNLAQETGSVQVRRDVMVAHMKLGECLQKAQNFPDALSHLRQARHQSDTLAKETGSVQARTDQALACIRLGDLYRSLQMIMDARMQHEAALQIREELFKELKTAESADDLAMIHYNIAFGATGETRQAHMMQAYKLWDMLVRVCPDQPSYRRKRDIVKQYL